jgi:hypothetical protein
VNIEGTTRVVGEVIGFRQWRVGSELELRSGNAAHAWTPGANTARCEPSALAMPVRPHSVVPAKDCHCGLYALHSPSSFWYGPRAERSLFSLAVGEGLYVAGVVAAWGRLEVHHSGFRAEHAQLVAIAVPDSRRDALLAKAIARDYRVPQVPQDQLEQVASEFGTLVSAELRPEKPPQGEDYWGLNYMSGLRSLFQQQQSALRFAYFPITVGSSIQAAGAQQPGKVSPAQPGDVTQAIRDLKAPINDPRQYKPKRDGGLR